VKQGPLGARMEFSHRTAGPVGHPRVPRAKNPSHYFSSRFLCASASGCPKGPGEITSPPGAGVESDNDIRFASNLRAPGVAGKELSMVLASQVRAGRAIVYENQTCRVVAADYHPGQGRMGDVTRPGSPMLSKSWCPSSSRPEA
jgi:hypothetical protein